MTKSSVTTSSIVRSHIPLGIIVAIACVAQFMVVLDSSIVNVALPAMRADLGMSTNGQQWVVDGYLITFGGLLLFAARAGDLFGRKWVFQCGLAIFTLASLVGGFAENGEWLIVARVVQGIGAAALAPASLSLITASHTDGHQRTKALAIWAVAASSAGAVGMILGGVLTSELNWRYVLFVNVPIGIALFVGAAICLMPSSLRHDGRRLDTAGALTITVGVGALVYAISQANRAGWGSMSVVISLIAAGALIAAFIVIEMFSRQPLVSLGIFRHRSLSLANVMMACLGVSMTSVIFFLSLYEQQILGYRALRTGLSLVPMTVVLVIGAFVAKRLIVAIGYRSLLAAGATISAIGVAWLSKLTVAPDYSFHVLGPTLVAGLGMSLMVLPVTVAATTGIEASDAGLASGLVNMGRQIGGAIGLAVLVAISSAATRHAGLRSPAAGMVQGYHMALLICAGISLLSAIIALFLPKAVRAIHAGPTTVTSGRSMARNAVDDVGN
ncbi:MFS transporter [Alicyclobacillus fodiniaquatilis]|uniref:MFS transporter n=1 Tax=Alicyclobacillus fodiniaquatilis TaxID=1661150 RepID=A0ABW4JPT6_9BACL